MDKNILNIVMITDNNYVAPTITAIRSLNKNRDKSNYYSVNIISTKLEVKNIQKLKALNRKNLKINVIDKNKEIEKYDSVKMSRHVSRAALLKFFLPTIFPEIEKILYIDSDVLILSDLAKLYDTDISNYYAGVVRDTLSILGRKYMNSIGIDNKYYFNSGVMLLNLDMMRKDNISKKLIDYKLNQEQKFMDQDAFNKIIGHNVKYLSYKYNFLNYYLSVMNQRELSLLFEEDITEYNSDVELYNSCTILHLGGKEKPWNKDMGYLTQLYNSYNKTIFTTVKNIFSIKNEGIHKIATILGIKFKFKSKKLIERERFNKLEGKLDYLTRELNGLKEVLKGKI